MFYALKLIKLHKTYKIPKPKIFKIKFYLLKHFTKLKNLEWKLAQNFEEKKRNFRYANVGTLRPLNDHRHINIYICQYVYVNNASDD